MIVRCGKCGAELEVAGAGEFLCPRCSTRNVVRGASAPSPFDLGQTSSPISAPPTGPPAPEPELTWISCPACSWKFVIGPDIEQVLCPTCRAALDVVAGKALLAPSES